MNKTFCDKLISVLNQISDSKNDVVEETYVENLMKLIEDELKPEKNGYKIFQPNLLINWLAKIQIVNENVNQIEFILRICGILVKNSHCFKSIKDLTIFDHINSLNLHSEETYSSIKLAYLYFLTNVTSHEYGVDWIRENKLWRNVVVLTLNDNSLYVQREGSNFIIQFLKQMNDNSELCEELFRLILLPLVAYEKNFSEEENLEKDIKPCLNLLRFILNNLFTNKEFKINIPYILCDVFYIEPILKQLIHIVESSRLLELICDLFTILSFSYVEYSSPSTMSDVFIYRSSQFVDILLNLINRNKITSALRLSELVQIYYNKLSKKNELNVGHDHRLEIQLTCIQLVPILMFIKKPTKEEYYLDSLIDKISSMTCETVHRLAFAMKRVIQDDPNADRVDLANKGILSLMENIELLPRDKAVVIFQSLMHVLKEFMPVNSEMEFLSPEQTEQVYLLSVSAESLLKAVLDAITNLIIKFKINWSESVESICVLKFTALLLKNPHLTPKLTVQALRIAKLAITNSMPPSLALLVDDIKGSSFVCLGPLLYRNLHHQSWEVRDSCLETILVIAELAEIKYLSFQDFLIDNDICKTVVHTSYNDSEYYVRATATKVMTAMVRSERLLTECNKDVNIVTRGLHVLQHDCEAVIRREVALFIKQVYISHKYSPTTLKSMHEVMLSSATNDLDWEVKVNCLLYWEHVIESLLSAQGMIDGVFPQVTFSKETKKIVNLTEPEIQSRLRKILNEMSELGLLNLLLIALLDDPDLQVVRTAAEITKRLKNILKKHNLLTKTSAGSSENGQGSGEGGMNSKRKSSGCEPCDKRLAPAPVPNTLDLELGAMDSDDVIDDIINERDISLLAGVYNKLTPARLQECTVARSGEQGGKLEPDDFVSRLQNMDIDGFVSEKINWLNKSETIDSLLDQILTLGVDKQTNMIDCY